MDEVILILKCKDCKVEGNISKQLLKFVRDNQLSCKCGGDFTFSLGFQDPFNMDTILVRK